MVEIDQGASELIRTHNASGNTVQETLYTFRYWTPCYMQNECYPGVGIYNETECTLLLPDFLTVLPTATIQTMQY